MKYKVFAIKYLPRPSGANGKNFDAFFKEVFETTSLGRARDHAKTIKGGNLRSYLRSDDYHLNEDYVQGVLQV